MVVSPHHPGHLGAAPAPADVLRQYATQHGYEVTVMGNTVLMGPTTR